MTLRQVFGVAALLAASAVTAAARVDIGVEVGTPYPAAPPPGYVAGPVGVAPGPGYVWINGYYNWVGGSYVWVPGRWELPPHGHHVWVAPYAHPYHHGHYHYHHGYWR